MHDAHEPYHSAHGRILLGREEDHYQKAKPTEGGHASLVGDLDPAAKVRTTMPGLTVEVCKPFLILL